VVSIRLNPGRDNPTNERAEDRNNIKDDQHPRWDKLVVGSQVASGVRPCAP
jgi:hypothetical protein